MAKVLRKKKKKESAPRVAGFWENADLSQTVKGSNEPYLGLGNSRVELVGIKSLVNHGRSGRTGKIFTVKVLETDGENVSVGIVYQVAYWMHLYGADKLRRMLKDSMDLDDEELSDRKNLALMTDDEDSPLIGGISTIQAYNVKTKKDEDFTEYTWGLFEGMEEADEEDDE